MKRLSIALLGSRGIPARYGGFETLMEELAPRLVARGFEVTVYCRPHAVRFRRKQFRGARLIHRPTIRSKHLDTPVHTFLSCLDALARRFDAALVVNSANALFLPLLSAAGVPVALNVDGIERRRAKWGPFGRAVYALSERLACQLPAALVTDAEAIRTHYRERYGVDSTVIAYGVAPRPPRRTALLPRLGLVPRGYFLYVSRFEPENNPHRVAEAYRAVGGDLPLVMVGGAPYAGGFIRSFVEGADPRIRFPGAIYGRGYRELLSHALAYVQASEVGGVHPALVEALGYGNCVFAHDTPENREAAGEAALFFDAHRPATLAARLEWARRAPEEAAARGRAAAAWAAARYDWEAIADRYAELLQWLAGGRPRRVAARAPATITTPLDSAPC